MAIGLALPVISCQRGFEITAASNHIEAATAWKDAGLKAASVNEFQPTIENHDCSASDCPTVHHPRELRLL
jgi:hypothetical protein